MPSMLGTYSTPNTSARLPLTYIVELEQSGDASHAASVAQAIALGYGINNSGAKSNYTVNGVILNTSLNVYNFIISRIIFRTGPIQSDALAWCAQNNVRICVCSDTGYNGSVTQYPQVQLFMPLGSNSHVQLYFNPDTESNVITAGSTTVISGSTTNGTGFGNALSFFDTDTVDGLESSFSNGIIAGKMLYIKEQRSIVANYEVEWWPCRYAAEQTALSNPDFPLHNLNQGWGKIDTAAAIAFSGSIPVDPFLP